MRNGEAIGAINITRRQTGEFSQAQIELLQVFANQAIIAITSAETYLALQERTAALAQRNSEYGERIDQQSATIDVLKVMAATPGDPQPAFDLIVRRAQELCNGWASGIAEFDGELIHLRAWHGPDRAAAQPYASLFPMALTSGSLVSRAIRERQIVHVRDADAKPDILASVRKLGVKSLLAYPLLRDGGAIGVIALTAMAPGGFSESQIELLKTFAEQAVIAITSAETYRALQVRTADLQQSLEYQTATSEVLKVISQSTFDLQPVLDMVAETAAKLCVADMAHIGRREGVAMHFAANYGFPPAYETYVRARGPVKLDPASPTVAQRTLFKGRPVHVDDVAAVPGYPEVLIRLGKHRTALGVPLLREGETIGFIQLSRRRVEPFTDRQIELVSTFADQAVIAIENTRLMTEQREALERQTATAEVLQVINASPGNLTPVFDALLEKALRLCDAAFGSLATYDGAYFQAVAMRGIAPGYAASLHRPLPPFPAGTGRLVAGESVVHIADITATDDYRRGIEHIRASADQGGMRTALFVALRKDDTLLGRITIFRQEVRPFTDKQIALIENFAAQAVIAMENARLLTEQRESLEQQTATAEVLQVINSSPGDLMLVFDALLERAMRLCEAAIGFLWTWDGEAVHRLAFHGIPVELMESLRQPFKPKPGSIPERIIAGDNVVSAADLLEMPDVPHRWPVLTRLRARSLVGVALRKDDMLLGGITIYRQEVRPFTEKQIALLQNFAAQAVIAMENARLLTETREALEQQTATAEVLQVINSSPGDLVPVFDAMLEKAMRLCGAAFGSFYTYDGERLHSAAQRGVPPAYAEYRANNPTPIRPGTGIAQAIRERRPHKVLDLMTTEAYAVGEPAVRAMVELGGVRTLLSAPLCKDEAVVGLITIYRQEVREFLPKQIAILENFAAQAVIAMENARLLREQREALEQQTATAEVLQVINASPGDLAPVFDAMLERALRLCGAAFGSLYTYDGERLHPVALRGVTSAFAELIAKSPPTLRQGSPQAKVVETKQPVQVFDLMDEEMYRSGPPRARALVEVGGVRSLLNVPLVKDDQVLGFFAIYRHEAGRFTDEQIALLQTFAAQAVIATENARLLTEQGEALEQQTATAEVLQVINSSPGNLAPVFDAMLAKAARLCDAELGQLLTYQGGCFHVASLYGGTPAFTEFMRRGPIKPGADTGLARLARELRVVHVEDLAAHETYRQRDPLRVASVELAGMRTFLAVPLLKSDTLFGAFVIYRQEVHPFSDRQIALLENFAAQAVIAMENARLLTEQQEALEQQTATAEVLQVINASPGDLAPVFDAMLEKAMRLCGAAFGVLWTYDARHIHAAAYRGVSPAFAELLTRGLHPVGPQNAHGRLLRGEQVVHIPDCAEDEAYWSGDPMRRALVTVGGGRTLLAVPLWKDETFLGDFVIYRTEVRPFSDKEIALLRSFADQAVIAMENARLLNEIRQRQDELRITFENMGDGVALFDEKRHLVASNRRFQDMLDVPDDVISARPAFADYIRYLADHGEYGPDAEDHVQRLLAFGGQPSVFERTRPNGRVIEVRGNPVPGGGFVVIYTDITERKRNEAEIRAARDAAEEASRTIETAYRDLKAAQANLIQAEKMASLGQLTAGIAHEIKNPLNFVNNFAELSGDLLDELHDAVAGNRQTEIDELTATLKGNLAKIAEHGNRADAIVRSMLEHSRGSSGERRPVNLNTLVDEALNLAYHGARAQDQSFNVTLQRDFGEGITPITLAPQDITRVLLNLFSNGFYAARRRQTMEVTVGFEPVLKVMTRDLSDAVEIRVHDNGIGIPEEVKDKLFQPFFTTKPTGEGTGLGLSISYDIVTQQHGGSIAVDSKVNEFTEFTVRLPRQ
jgi:GAF domain-containing protein/nitrogen-specific signal transduction histidine kinase